VSSNDQDHADGNAERCGNDASEEAIGNALHLNAPHAPHAVAQVEIYT
jgi:hypothetical protein